jgi:hypothetical protein
MSQQSDDGITRAPWAPEQTASLNAYQTGIFHPFTCGDDGCRAAARPKQATLIAYPDGWRCPRCEYTQDWAHTWMTDGSWRNFTLAALHAFMGTTHGAYIYGEGRQP